MAKAKPLREDFRVVRARQVLIDLSEIGHEVVLKKLIPAQICKVILYYYYVKDNLTDLCGN